MATELMAIGRRTGRQNVASGSSLTQLTRLEGTGFSPPQATHTPSKSAASVKDDFPISGRTSLVKYTQFLPEPPS